MPAVAALAIVNARGWTGDRRRPWIDAVLLRAGRIEAAGSSAEVKKRTDASTRVVDAGGMFLIPAFTELHPNALSESFDLASRQLHAARLEEHAPSSVGPSSAVVWTLGGTVPLLSGATTLAPGMPADLLLIDRDLTRIALEAVRDAQVMLAIVRGRVVYDPAEVAG
jgi:predicted amidohydrolase YtcJ